MGVLASKGSGLGLGISAAMPLLPAAKMGISGLTGFTEAVLRVPFEAVTPLVALAVLMRGSLQVGMPVPFM